MPTKPRQFAWWRRREVPTAAVPQGRVISPTRARALLSAAIVGVVAWMIFYSTMGNYRIERLDEFAHYLRGEDLYRKHEVSRISWDCDGLRRQFASQYIADRADQLEQDDERLVFRRPDLTDSAFTTWVDGAMGQLAFGKARRVENEGTLVPAMMVRLFHEFRFESGDLSRTIANDFNNKCRR